MTRPLIYAIALVLVAFVMARMPVLDHEQNVADEVIQAPIDALLAQKE